MNERAKVIHGDCIEVMQQMEPNSIDAIVTDPPYGLGFMGKKWDALPPGREWAEECVRVLKPGGHILAFGGSRTWHRLAVAIEDGGFEIRDSIAWLYGSGFPKHRAALKPAFEPIVMGRKPFKGPLVANEAKRGTGALNIDGCRIGTSGATRKINTEVRTGSITAYGNGLNGGRGQRDLPFGRWPANVILDETQAEVLDGQSGNIKGIIGGMTQTAGAVTFKVGDEIGAKKFTPNAERIKDEGGASRFFKVAEADAHGAISQYFPREFEAPFKYEPKAPKRERPMVDGVAHPTVKPLDLMRWLVRLVTPEGGVVLDPFAGSGTTLEAATLEGFHSIGIEREAEYLPLIQARLNRATAA